MTTVKLLKSMVARPSRLDHENKNLDSEIFRRGISNAINHADQPGNRLDAILRRSMTKYITPHETIEPWTRQEIQST